MSSPASRNQSAPNRSRPLAMDVEDIGSGRPVLAIHGLGGGAYFFRSIAERLRHDYRIISVDLPTTPGCSMAAWVDELGTIVDERVGGPVVILGHSMGTIIGLEAWRAWPEKLRGLVLVGGIPRVAAPHIHERLSERVQALRPATDLEGWGKRVSPGVFAAISFQRRPEKPLANSNASSRRSQSTPTSAAVKS